MNEEIKKPTNPLHRNIKFNFWMIFFCWFAVFFMFLLLILLTGVKSVKNYISGATLVSLILALVVSAIHKWIAIPLYRYLGNKIVSLIAKIKINLSSLLISLASIWVFLSIITAILFILPNDMIRTQHVDFMDYLLFSEFILYTTAIRVVLGIIIISSLFYLFFQKSNSEKTKKYLFWLTQIFFAVILFIFYFVLYGPWIGFTILGSGG